MVVCIPKIVVMKRLMLLLFMICVVWPLNAQTSQVKVTLKSGVVIKGTMKELKAMEYAIVNVAGIDSKILMENIESIEDLGVVPSKDNNVTATDSDTKQSGQYIVTDNGQYPDSFEINVRGQEIKMILVRGGRFSMGYDGPGSLSMKSEPVHNVEISSYYISADCLNDEVASLLLGKVKNRYKGVSFSTYWEKAKQIVDNIVILEQKPFRMLTEAEWEYAALMPFSTSRLGMDDKVEWCSDFYAEYDSRFQINPTGPSKGRRHVCRSFKKGRNKWDRKPLRIDDEEKACIRIAISADAIK